MLSGLHLGVGTALASAVLDQQVGVSPESGLYIESWTAILFNLLVLGPLVYSHVCRSATKSIARTVSDVVGLVGVHSILYAGVHWCMHRIVACRPIHRFHHRFEKVVMPSSANAVSCVEFVSAYMMPFAVGAALLRPSDASLACATVIVSGFNLAVHSRFLEKGRWVPGFVHPKDHLEHHATRSRRYAAPTFSI